MELLKFKTETSDLKKLGQVRLNLLIGCMHSHNELAVLNRLLLFAQNETAQGEAYASVKAIQVWTYLQIVIGKLFETWIMLKERLLDNAEQAELITSLTEKQKESLSWLTNYFGRNPLKKSPLKIIRDKTGFHYDGMDLGQVLNKIPESEQEVYLARHPANTTYVVGSMTVFRAAFSLVAQECGLAGEVDIVRAGMLKVMDDTKEVNLLMHDVLYGLIKHLLETAKGGDLGDPAMVIAVEDVPTPDQIGIPCVIKIGKE